jgi:uncharacterized membrane protein HdeD (DUF308 family)
MPLIEGLRITHDTDPETARSRWLSRLALGLLLIACGICAIVLPTVSDLATGAVLGVVLVVIGVAKMIQGLRAGGWEDVNWQILLGAMEIVGGVLIYLNPLKGALAITLMIATMLLVEAVMHVALAFRVRPRKGWAWMLGAGAAAFAASIGITMTARWTQYITPGSLAGAAILVAGWAHVAIALASRRVQS